MEGERQNIFVRTWRKGRAAYAVLSEHRYTTIAGTLVFFLIMSLTPLLFWLTLLFGKAGLPAEEIFELELFGWAKELLLYLRNNAQGATAGVSVLLLATTLWSSTGFFYHLRRSGEIVYGYDRNKRGWKVRLSALAFTGCVLLFILFGGGLLVAVHVLSRALPVWLGYPAVYLFVLVIGFFAAWLLNAYVCPYRARPSDTVQGSAITAGAWMLASVAFSVYLNFSDQQKLYGAFSLVIVFLLWLYWMMICFTVGLIYNRQRMRTKSLQHKRY